jgi:hypothetical protein
MCWVLLLLLQELAVQLLSTRVTGTGYERIRSVGEGRGEGEGEGEGDLVRGNRDRGIWSEATEATEAPQPCP